MTRKYYDGGIVATTDSGSELITNDVIIPAYIYWVDSVTGNPAGPGTKESPYSTLAAAVAVVGSYNNDVIICMATHTEVLAASVDIYQKEGLRIFGLGTGTTRAQFTINANIDGLNIRSANIQINNLLFNEGTAAHTAAINVASAGVNARIEACKFDLGANELKTITITDARDCYVEDCTFTCTANGPDSAILVEHLSATGLVISGNTFDADEYGFDDAAVYSAVAHTDFTLDSNTFTNGASCHFTAASKGWASNNTVDDNSFITITDGRFEIYEEGIADEDSGADTFITNGNLIITGRVIWVDSVNGDDANAGTKEYPVASLTGAQALSTPNVGDIIVFAEGHSETYSATITLDSGVKHFGIGSGSDRPQFKVSASGDIFDMSGINMEINNLYFGVGTIATTARLNVNSTGAIIKNCEFRCGVYDADAITIDNGGDSCTIDNCMFVVDADGPNSGIKIESDSAYGILITNCSFNGGTYNWDDGAIYSSVQIKNHTLYQNTLTNNACIIFSNSTNGIISKPIAGDNCRIKV